jgi:ribosomal protein S18 acetylase RimI-like enzyme
VEASANSSLSDGTHPSLRERPATIQDLDALWELHLSTMKEYLNATACEQEEQRKLFRDEWPDNYPSTRVLCDGERIVATTRVNRAPESIYLATLEVDPEFQGRGIGSDQICRLLEEGRRNGIPVWLNVLKTDPRAQALYERLGFRAVAENATHVRMQAEPSHASAGRPTTP